MRELKLLIKAELRHLMHSLNPGTSRRKSGAAKQSAFYVFAAFAGGLLVFYSFLYSNIMADAFEQINALYLLPGLMMTAASVMTLFATVYKVKGTLFGFRDYEFLMSLPLTTRAIVVSRLFSLYLLNLVLCSLVMLPAGTVYVLRELPPGGFFPVYLAALLFLPMVPVTIGAFVGLLIQLAASHFRYRNAATLIITMMLFTGVMLLSFSMPSFLNNLQDLGRSVMLSVNRVYPLALLFTDGIRGPDYAKAVGFIAISCGLFAAFALFSGRFFKKINTILNDTPGRREFTLGTIKSSRPQAALYKREMRRYVASTNYVLNTAVGYIMMTMAAIALLVSGREKLAMFTEIPGFSQGIERAAPAVLAFFVLLSCTTASAVSLEGKHLWILKSLPVGVREIFLSKMAVNLSLAVPAILLNATVFAIVFRFGLLQTLMLYVLPLTSALFITAAGLVINLHYPIFDWTTDIKVIKQSAAVMIASLGGLACAGALIAAVFMFDTVDGGVISLGASAVFGAAAAGLYRYLMTKGVRMFDAF